MTHRPLDIEIITPGQGRPISLTLHDGEGVVVGRNPDASTLAGGDTRVVHVASANVSTNHVSIQDRDNVACLVDLGSRNGTWLKLPRHGEVTLAVPAEPLSLRLASQEMPATTHGPADTSWTSAKDYAGSLTACIVQWLHTCDLPTRVSVVDGAPDADAVGRIPLATGRDLLVEPLGTVGGSWLEALAVVERYVARQNVLFETEQTMREEGLIVASPAFRKAVARVIEIAASGARVLLLTGASGTGKEGLARCFHRHTQRPGPFIARNCAMFSKELVRSELFGAERGAFTGSVQRIVGAVEAANEGTLFLDELGELPREVQPMLLRFLDHGEYERLGRAGTPLATDVKIVCATNRDLRAATLTDAFRTDLWFRLSVHVVDVPLLRDRFEDIEAYLKSRTRPDGSSLYDRLAPETRALLAEHDWQGNFRELVSFAERLHHAAVHGQIPSEVACAALAEGALHPITPVAGTPARDPGTSIVELARRASAAFAVDRGGTTPTTWDEVKDFVENYLKPVLFAELSASAQATRLDDVDLREAAELLRSDRGTAVKQLRRYFDRFAERA
ncbi:MAG: sigma 54-interacting transcriptional regulator [Proteobacteria bacterium]|nr:sigma 54-interacting transcriptional regulator [Pseudomonadota bacterium]